MKMIKNAVLLASIISICFFSACKKKTSDADIQKAVETAWQAGAMPSGTTVTVDKGVVTISGVCNDEASKTRAGELAKEVKGVKEVVNNCTVTPVVFDPVVNADDAALTQGLNDALKDNPGVKYTLSDGKIVLTGEISKAKWASLKQMLDKLKSKGYELSGLQIK